MTGTKAHQGFSLIEILVAASVFALIMIMVGSVFVSSLVLQRRAFNIQQVEENATFILETLAKEIRVSQVSSPAVSCSTASPATTLSIIHPDYGALEYGLSGGGVYRSTGSLPPPVISSNTIEFTRFGFCISGVSAGQQPRVTVVATVRSAKTSQQTSLDFQTTLSPRLLNETP